MFVYVSVIWGSGFVVFSIVSNHLNVTAKTIAIIIAVITRQIIIIINFCEKTKWEGENIQFIINIWLSESVAKSSTRILSIIKKTTHYQTMYTCFV